MCTFVRWLLWCKTTHTRTVFQCNFSCVRSRHIMCAHFSFKQTLNVCMWMCVMSKFVHEFERECVFFSRWILLHSFDGKNRQMIENCGKQKRENFIDFCCSFFSFPLFTVDIDRTNGKTFWGAFSLAHTHSHQSYLHLTLNTLNDSKKLNVHNSGRIVFLRHYFRNFRLAFSAKRMCLIVRRPFYRSVFGKLFLCASVHLNVLLIAEQRKPKCEYTFTGIGIESNDLNIVFSACWVADNTA